MVEAPNLRISPEYSGVSYVSTLRRNVRWHAEEKKYRDIPRYTRRVVKKAALHALLIPREDLYKRVVDLDREAREAQPESVVAYDNREHKTLEEYRDDVMKLREKKKERRFTHIEYSTYLTRLDRMLIASRYTVMGVSRRMQNLTPKEIFESDEFLAAHKMCIDIIVKHFPSLPPYLRRDPEILDPDPDTEFADFKHWIHQGEVKRSSDNIDN